MSTVVKTNILIFMVASIALLSIKLRLFSAPFQIYDVTIGNTHITAIALIAIWSCTLYYVYRWKDDKSTLAVAATYLHAFFWSALVLLNTYFFVGLMS